MEKAKLNKQSLENFFLNYALYIVLFIMILFFIVKEPSFLSVKNFTNILTQASTRGIMALGVAGLIVLQGTDLSAGRILGLTAVISASLLQSTTYASRFKSITTNYSFYCSYGSRRNLWSYKWIWSSKA